MPPNDGNIVRSLTVDGTNDGAYGLLPEDATDPQVDNNTKRLNRNKALVLIITFFTYACFGMSRRPTAVVKVRARLCFSLLPLSSSDVHLTYT